MNLEKVKADLPKFRLHLNKETLDWWEVFFQNNGRIEDAKPTWILPKLNKYREETNEEQPSSEMTMAEAELVRIVEREEREVEVNIE